MTSLRVEESSKQAIRSVLNLWAEGHITFQTVLDTLKKELPSYGPSIHVIVESPYIKGIKAVENRGAEAIKRLLEAL